MRSGSDLSRRVPPVAIIGAALILLVFGASFAIAGESRNSRPNWMTPAGYESDEAPAFFQMVDTRGSPMFCNDGSPVMVPSDTPEDLPLETLDGRHEFANNREAQEYMEARVRRGEIPTTSGADGTEVIELGPEDALRPIPEELCRRYRGLGR